MLLRRAKGDLRVCQALADDTGIDDNAIGFHAQQATLPDKLASVEWLTPWAVDLRYDEPTSLDRQAALGAAESAVGWATGLLNA